MAIPVTGAQAFLGALESATRAANAVWTEESGETSPPYGKPPPANHDANQRSSRIQTSISPAPGMSQA
jgi:hypothetical protein